jgi:hypothetical protein
MPRAPKLLDHERFAARAERALGRQWATRFARGVGVHYASVKRWRSGTTPVPDYANAILELLESTPRAFLPERWIKIPRKPPTKPAAAGEAAQAPL